MNERVLRIKERVDQARDDRRLVRLMDHYARLGHAILDQKGYLTASDGFLVNLMLAVAKDEGLPSVALSVMRKRAVEAGAFAMAEYACQTCVPTATEEAPAAGQCDHCGAKTSAKMTYKVPRSKAKL